MRISQRFWSLLVSQRGAVGDLEEADDATPGEGEEPSGEDGQDATDEGDADVEASSDEEPFINPEELPDEVKPHFKRMQAAFTKKMQALREDRDKLDRFERFFNDPEFARQTIMSVAPQMGLQVVPQGQQATGQTQQTQPQAGSNGDGAPQELVSEVEARLPDELKWLAPSLATASWTANQKALKPLLEKQEAQTVEQRKAEFERLSQELNSKAPGWEEHEEDMDKLLEFMRSPRLEHPVFGSKLDILYNMATKNRLATQEATRRIAASGRNRTSTGRSTSRTDPNIGERIKGAKTEQEAWEIAAEAAVQQLKTQGA